ncbi:MAG: hypothetical protein M3Z56_04170 [Bacteroidota bacterium]|nr:hypothetical protein [Bacteroidota bacterium]
MINSTEILNELMGISPLLAGLEKVNVFQVPEGYFDKLDERLFNFALANTNDDLFINKGNPQYVPEGYFDSLSTNILAKIRKLNPEVVTEESASLSPLLYSLKDKTVFKVPEGYFDSLGSNVLAKIKESNIEKPEEGLQNLSPLLYSLKDKNAFKIPEGYFDSLGSNVLAKIKESNVETSKEELQNLSPLLYSLKDENVFKVPEEYFDSLGSNVLAKIKESNVETSKEETQNLSPLLYSLKDENVFKVPEGYFENFAGDLINKLQPSKAKIVVMRPRNTWMKIAAAAVITGIIAISSLRIFNNSSNINNSNPLLTASADVPRDVNDSYKFKTEEQLDAGIARLSDDEIIKYLERNGNVMDNELLLNNTDVSELPSESDYLYDENTLNSYLGKIVEKGKSQ